GVIEHPRSVKGEHRAGEGPGPAVPPDGRNGWFWERWRSGPRIRDLVTTAPELHILEEDGVVRGAQRMSGTIRPVGVLVEILEGQVGEGDVRCEDRERRPVGGGLVVGDDDVLRVPGRSSEDQVSGSRPDRDRLAICAW